MSDSKNPPNEVWSKLLPNLDALLVHPLLGPIASRLKDPALWRLRQESVARGVAVGLFWAFAAPFAQVLIAIVHCAYWRAHIPIAAAMTMITNPLTLVFWIWLAYLAGSWLTGAVGAAPPSSVNHLSDWLLLHGGTALIGMGLFAVVGSVAGYLIVKVAWRTAHWVRCKRRVYKMKAASRLKSANDINQ